SVIELSLRFEEAVRTVNDDHEKRRKPKRSKISEFDMWDLRLKRKELELCTLLVSVRFKAERDEWHWRGFADAIMQIDPERLGEFPLAENAHFVRMVNSMMNDA